jgi:hypothetical protein
LDPWLLDEGSTPKSGKLRLNLHGTILEGNSIGSDPQKKRKRKEKKKEKNSKEKLMISTIKM